MTDCARVLSQQRTADGPGGGRCTGSFSATDDRFRVGVVLRQIKQRSAGRPSGNRAGHIDESLNARASSQSAAVGELKMSEVFDGKQ